MGSQLFVAGGVRITPQLPTNYVEQMEHEHLWQDSIEGQPGWIDNDITDHPFNGYTMNPYEDQQKASVDTWGFGLRQVSIDGTPATSLGIDLEGNHHTLAPSVNYLLRAIQSDMKDSGLEHRFEGEFECERDGDRWLIRVTMNGKQIEVAEHMLRDDPWEPRPYWRGKPIEVAGFTHTMATQ